MSDFSYYGGQGHVGGGDYDFLDHIAMGNYRKAIGILKQHVLHPHFRHYVAAAKSALGHVKEAAGEIPDLLRGRDPDMTNRERRPM